MSELAEQAVRRNLLEYAELMLFLPVTMTAGVGGSLLSIGSAAAVALMGQTSGKYSRRYLCCPRNSGSDCTSDL